METRLEYQKEEQLHLHLFHGLLQIQIIEHGKMAEYEIAKFQAMSQLIMMNNYLHSFLNLAKLRMNHSGYEQTQANHDLVRIYLKE